MDQNFQINSEEIDKIKKISLEEKKFRIKNLELFKDITKFSAKIKRRKRIRFFSIFKTC